MRNIKIIEEVICEDSKTFPVQDLDGIFPLQALTVDGTELHRDVKDELLQCESWRVYVSKALQIIAATEGGREYWSWFEGELDRNALADVVRCVLGSDMPFYSPPMERLAAGDFRTSWIVATADPEELATFFELRLDFDSVQLNAIVCPMDDAGRNCNVPLRRDAPFWKQEISAALDCGAAIVSTKWAGRGLLIVARGDLLQRIRGALRAILERP